MKERILVAEDDRAILTGVADLLESEGYEVVPAGNGAEALDLYRRHAPDLVLLDVMMPKMSGIELIQRVRQDPELSGIKILMLTARSQEGDRIRARNSGADDYLVKPFAATNLLASLQALEQQI